MPKRPRDEADFNGSEGNSEANKRRNFDPAIETNEQALALLLNQAENLIEHLRKLQKASSSGVSVAVVSQGQLLQDLQSASTVILPAVRLLAKDGVNTHQVKDVARDGSSRENISGAALLQTPTSGTAGSQSTQPRASQVSSVSAPPVPSPLLLTPFQAENIASSLPPLPPILDQTLETAVFTHAGMAKIQKSQLSYDRLEWLGDAYSELISSTLLFSTFGRASPGRLSQLRELLICNSNLGKYAAKYGLMQRVHLSEEFKNSKDAKKIPGDVFEAYVAAVILSDPENGLRRAGEWLKALYSMTIKDQIRELSRKPEMRHIVEMDREQKVPIEEEVPPKQRLSTLIAVQGVKLRYEDDKGGPKKDKYNNRLNVFTVNLYLDGWGEKNKWLGKGTDLNKKVAGQKAAQMALDNASLMKKYRDKKLAFLAARDEEGAENDNVDSE
ncbi:ribonuclease III [Sodiomyces alkalinus F11]|uniref:Ribonuclease III n=1 Tax=Sodiomyces alkalinus (strain CBS 110278 / VKM F-3762 / F11) TaxID=1314773 RepID=A0A3N2Q9Y7_SODAK|nr:ribonuclease III [Sodiomyces alkalinus F11]ROT43527.1 ribonuclease III [Sodiomyces alkalinus F11]